MTSVADICERLQCIAPLALSEDWDNTGLLLGDPDSTVERLQTCLTLTPTTVVEAVERHADLVVAHHPLPFKPVARITTQTVPGKLLWQLASHRIAVYSPHTAWDSAEQGINVLLAQQLELQDLEPIVPASESDLPGLGSGRIGMFASPRSLIDVADRLRQSLPACRMRAVDAGSSIRRVAICCGSGGSLLGKALEKNCDLFLTGEATFHTCLEAEAAEVSMLMIGHFASERFAMEHLADQLAKQLPAILIWASEREKDPVISL